MFNRKALALAAALVFAPAAAVAQINNPGVVVSGAPANNDCAKFVVSAGTVQSITTAGAACGAGGGGSLTIGTTTISGGTTGRVLYDNTGVVGEYTQTQLTAQINLATAALSGSVPAFPNNTTTFLRGDLTWQTLNFAALSATPTTLAGYGISSPLNIAQGGTASTTLTANGVMLGAGTGAIQFALIGTGGRVLIDQGAGVNPAFTAMSGDATLTIGGALTVANGAIINTKLANMASMTIKGNVTGGPAAPADLTLTNFATFFASGNNAAPAKLKYFNSSDVSADTAFGPFVSVIASQSGTFGGNAFLCGTVQDVLGATAFSFPTGCTAYASLGASGAGNAAFPFFARGDISAFGAMTSEFNCNQSVNNSPVAFPPNLSRTGANNVTNNEYCLGMQIVSIGPNNPHTALRIALNGGAPWLAGAYIDAGAITDYGFFVDASSSAGPLNDLVLRNTGQGSNIHALFQTTGAAVPGNAYVQHQNAAGSVTSQINQDGTVIVNKSATPQAAPTTGVDFYGRGADNGVPGAGNWFDTFGGAGFTVYRRADGTGSSPSSVATGDVVGLFSSKIYVNGAYTADTSRVTFVYTGAGGASSDNGTQIQFATTMNGTTSLLQAAVLQDDGSMTLGLASTNRWCAPTPGCGTIATTGGLALGSLSIKTANYAMVTSDSTLGFNGAGSITLTLLAAASYSGRILFVLNLAAQTVVSATSNVIPQVGGATSTAILAGTAGKWAILQSTGSQWQIIASN